MTTKELQERLNKANETVTKKENLLVKYQTKYEKIRQDIITKGYDPDVDRYQMDGTPKHEECYWLMCDLDDVQERIEATAKAIVKAKETADKWAVKLKAEKAKEKEREQFPQALKEYEQYLVKMWDEWDMERLNRLKEEYEKLRYREFMNKYSLADYNLVVYSTKESIHKDNVKNANASVFNLWQRVKDTVGDVVDYNLHTANGNSMEGMAINGIVKGTKGTAEVTTIGAGGYNIQRYHFRVLVNRYPK